MSSAVSWRNFEAVEFATLEWVDWFNNRRRLEPIGNIPPAEAEERYYALLDAPAMAAPGAVQYPKIALIQSAFLVSAGSLGC